MQPYAGVIIEESLKNKDVLKLVQTISTKVKSVNEKHKTPWVKQWTMDTVEISQENVQSVAESLSHSLDSKHNWYADFKNDHYHYIVFRDKIFFVNRNNKDEYDEATKYGVSIGIPDYQLDFSPHVKRWKS